MQSLQKEVLKTTIEVFIECVKHDRASVQKNFNDVTIDISYDGRTIKVTLGSAGYTVREMAITASKQEYELCRSELKI
ncbi:hypothetical protein [Chroococcidiopsis sp.]|uniref:hypothetical protein n=1 Tax=Chroococcidiopsis sp. TaxID=3088168 RepID=UPI003F2CAF2E